MKEFYIIFYYPLDYGIKLARNKDISVAQEIEESLKKRY